MSSIEHDSNLQLDAIRRIEIEDPSALRQNLSRLQSERAELESEYESGDSDLTYAEVRAKLKQYDASITDLSTRAAEARALAQIKNATEISAWEKSVQRLKESTRGQKVDYTKNGKADDLLDRHVKYLAEDPANANKSADWLLRTAHSMTLDRLTGDHGDDVLAVKNVGGLKGMELEKALARMSPEEAEAWLNS